MAKYNHKSIILLALLIVASACSVEVPFDPYTLRTRMGSEPATLNPIIASDASASVINNHINDSLIDNDLDTLDFRPKLAESWDVLPDGKSFIFHLRKNAKWHDGEPFNADDVIYSFSKIEDEKVDAPFLRAYYAGVTFEKIDDHTVKCTYKEPYFLALSFCGGMPLVPQHVFDDGQDFNRHSRNRSPIGTGPYVFKEWKTNKRIVLERNENYWGKKPDIRRIEYRIVGDDAIAFQMLKKGELDLDAMRPIQWVKQTNSKKFNQMFGKYKYLTPGYRYIGWNNRSFLFSDAKVRLAMTYLVDRQKLLDKLLFGLGQVVEAPFFVESDQYNKDLKNREYNVQRARELLAEAGWKDTDHDGWLDKEGKKFEFTFLIPSGRRFYERLGTIMKEDLEKLGIQMDIERMEWAAFLNKIEQKDFDATCLGWSTSFEGDPYQVWHSSQGIVERGSNFISYSNKKADRLMERARVLFDKEKRNALYWKFQKVLYDDQPYTFLFSGDSLVAVSKRFENVIVHKAGLDILDWKVKQEI